MRLITNPVKRSRKYEGALQLLGGKDSTMFPTLREALSFCAVLGYRERRRLPLDPSAGTEDIAGAQYQLNEAVDIVFALALAQEKSSDILRPEREKECIEIYEQFANGGLDLISGWIDQYANLDVDEAVFRGLRSIGLQPPKSSQNSEIVTPTF